MIRLAKAEDVAAIRAIAEKAYQLYIERLGKPPAPMVADFATHIDHDRVIVFEQEGDISGYAILVSDERRALLDNIAVDPACQRSGIGLALIDHVERQAKAQGHEVLDLYTNVVMTENVTWYERLGFVETRRADEDGFSRVYMRKVIGSTARGSTAQ